MAAFARVADKNTQPVRKIEGQKTMLCRTMHVLTCDEIHDEVMVPQQFAEAILTFAGGTEGETPPLRVIQGSRTRLEAPDRVAVDAVNNEIFVPEGDKVLVFDRMANGNVAPIRAIEGPDVGRGMDVLAIDPVNNLLIVGVGGGGGDLGRGTRFFVFDRTANGNVKPKMIIKGPNAMGGPFTIYPPKKFILATNRPSDESLAGEDSYLGVWSYEKSSDDGKPLWTIGGPKGIFQKPCGVTPDVKKKNIIASG